LPRRDQNVFKTCVVTTVLAYGIFVAVLGLICAAENNFWQEITFQRARTSAKLDLLAHLTYLHSGNLVQNSCELVKTAFKAYAVVIENFNLVISCRNKRVNKVYISILLAYQSKSTLLVSGAEL